MDEREQVLFRTGMFGFEKKQVLSYIDSVWSESRNAQQELEKKLEEVSGARSELERQVGEFERKMTQLERHLEEEKDRIRELTGQISSLNRELGEQKELGAKRSKELSIQQEHNRQLQLRLRESEQKAQKYDEAVDDLGELLIDAKRNAGEILKAAEMEAAVIKRDAAEAAGRITEEVRSFRGELDRVRETVEELMHSLGARLDGIDAVISKMEQRAVEVRRTAEQTCPSEGGKETAQPGSAEPEAAAGGTSFFRGAAKA